jgi:Outer membrane protein beta-barrel domain
MMSIKSILSVALLLAVSAVHAQDKKFQQGDSERFFRFGAKGGVNINKISGQSYKSGFNYNYQLGGFLQFNFSNRFGLQPEVNFVQSSSEFSNDATDVYDDLFRSGSQKNAKLNYLEIPLLLNINVGESKHIKLQFGPAYGVRLSESVDSLVNNIDIYKGGDWSAIGGLWIQLPVVHLGARYKYGLTNINSVDNREKWKAQAIQIFIGITI